MVAILIAGFVFLTAVCFAQPQKNSKQDESLRKFLQDYLAVSRSDDREPTRYSSAFVDLRDDGTQEIIVYVTGDFFCGSGGCTTLILAPKDSSYRVVTKMSTTRSPIRVLETKSNGWHDISIMKRVWYGEGNIYAQEEKLSFNGKYYRTSAQRSVEKIPGEVVIPATGLGLPLY